MPIITKAGTPVKGSPTQFTLDKSALAAVTSVAADAYFSDTDNWKQVQLNYKSSVGKQSKAIKFDATLASPTANFAVSLKARDVFEIHNVVIKDFDGGSFKVPRSALTTAEFDVDMTPTPASSLSFSSALKSADLSLATSLILEPTNVSAPIVSWGYFTNTIDIAGGGKYYWEMSFVGIAAQAYVGATFANAEPNNFYSTNYPFNLDPVPWNINAGFYQRQDEATIAALFPSMNYTSTTGAVFASGDTVMLAIDLDNSKVFIGVNGTWAPGQNPTTNVGGLNISAALSGQSTVYPAVAINTGQCTLVATPTWKPAGYTFLGDA